MTKNRKEKKLNRVEKDLLKAMDRELQEQQVAANAQLAAIDAELSENISASRKEAAAKAYAAQQAFEKEKKELDKQKKAALKAVEDNYQLLLAAIRSTKTYEHTTLEDQLDFDELQLRRKAKAEEKKVDAALADFITDYNARRDLLLYGASEEPEAETEKPKKETEPPADKISASVEA